MVKEYNMEGDIKLLIWPAPDPRLKPGISDAGFRRWWDRGIPAVCTLTQLLKKFWIVTKRIWTTKQRLLPIPANKRLL